MFFFYVEPGIQRKLIFPQISQINADFFLRKSASSAGITSPVDLTNWC